MNEIRLVTATDLTFANEAKTAISMVVEVEGVAEITTPVDFVASMYDTMEHGREWFQRAMEGEFGAIKPYVPAEKDLVEEARMFFEEEKQVALRIEEDYRLELANISDEQMREVKEYLKAIKPSYVLRDAPIRPEIMDQYDYVKEAAQ